MKIISKVVLIIMVVLINNLISQNNQTLIPYRNIDKWGFCDIEGNIKIPPKYDYVSLFKGEYAIGSNNGEQLFGQGDSHWVINRNGKIIFKTIGRCDILDSNLFKDNRGILNAKEIIIIPEVELGNYSYELKENRIKVKKNDKYGIKDTKGNLICDYKYDEIHSFSDGLAEFGIGKSRKLMKWGYLDLDGNEVIKAQFSWSNPFSEGLAAVNIDGLTMFIDKKRKIKFKLKYKDLHGDFTTFSDRGGNVHNFKEGICRIDVMDSTIFIDKNGTQLFDKKFPRMINSYFINDMVGSFPAEFISGITTIQKNSKYGYMDKNGNEIIQCKYNLAKPFYNNWAIVRFNSGSFGIIDKNGNEIISDIYDDVDHLEGSEYSNIISVNSLYNMEPTIRIGYLNIKTGKRYWKDASPVEFVRDGDFEKLKIYIENGGDVNFKERDTQKSLLQLAIQLNKNEIAIYLIQSGADVCIKDIVYRNPVLLAIQESNKIILEKIFENNKPNCFQQHITLPQLGAMYIKDQETYKIILENSTQDEINNKTKNYGRPIDIAKKKKNNSALELLIKYGANK